MTDLIALDDSMRAKDADGHLRVAMSHISKAKVNPYLGSEIPGWEDLGLQKDRVYHLLRDPEELAKSAPTFAGKPILIKHKPTSADDHQKDLTVGSIGSDVVFNAPYLDADLTIWDGEAIALIESGKQEQLSCGYRYRPDMTSGEYEGIHYDGVMRDIQGNHLALVEVGRAGADVIVHDHDPFKEETQMKPSEKRLSAAKAKACADIKAVLGLDGNNPELDKILTKFAQDAKACDEEKDEKKAEDDDMDNDDQAEDEDDEKDEKDKPAEDEDDEADEADKPGGKTAMDQSIIRKQARKIAQDEVNKALAANDALHAARRAVEPVVGVVTMDSAEAVYRFALDHLDVDHKGLPASALPTVYALATKSNQPMATDEATVSATTEFAKSVHLDRFK